MPSYKYFVVWQGRETGIYDNWNECAAQVNDFPSAAYQGCDSIKEAQELMAKGGKQNIANAHRQTSLLPEIITSAKRPSKITKNQQDSTTLERKVLNKDRFSFGTHTYFFEVKETSNGSNYIVIDQRRKVGEEFESAKLRIFEDELLEFNRVLQKMTCAALSEA